MLPAVTHAITGRYLLCLLQLKSQHEADTKSTLKVFHTVSCIQSMQSLFSPDDCCSVYLLLPYLCCS